MKRASFAVLLILLGAAAFASTASAVRADDVLHVGTAGKETDAEVYYAQDMGFFKKAGLTVDIQTMPNGAAVAAAVASGALQIGDSNVLSISVARQKNLPFSIFAPGAMYSSASPTTAFAVAVNGPIRSARDLNGKTVAGVSLGGLDQLSMQSWIDKNGGDSGSVKFVELVPAQMIAALDRGTVAAVSLPDPILDAAVAEKTVRIIGNNYDGIAKSFLITAWFATNDWLLKNADTAKRFADVMAETADWANANHEKAAEILLKYTKVDARQSHVRFARRLSASIVQPVVDMGIQYRMLDRTFALNDVLSIR